MAKFADYTRFAASFCPNLPSIVFERAILIASRVYFSQTQSWRESMALALEVGVNDYEMPLPFESAIVDRVLSVSVGEVYLSGLTRKPLKTSTGPATHYLLHADKEHISVYPTPTEAGTALIEVSITPSIDTTSMPSVVFDQHFDALLVGALWQIKRMTNTDWYDPQAAMKYEQEFYDWIEKKKLDVMTLHSSAEMTMTIPDFV